MESNRVKILVVDDEPGARKLLSSILGETYQISLAESVDDALVKVSSEKPHIVVTDIRMPGKDGLFLLEKLTESEPEIIVILITGHSDKEMAIAAVQKGAFDFLEKPFSAKELRNSVSKAFEKITMKHEIYELKHKSQELAKSAAIGMIATNIANEIHAPLQNIKNELTTLASSESFSGESQSKFKDIEDEITKISEKLSAITRKFDKSTAPAKNPTQNLEPVVIGRICEDLKRLSNERITSQGIYFSINQRLDDGELIQNPVEITQAILKLIENSCDSIESLREKWIKLDFISRGEFIELSVTDSGSGIDEKVKEKIFEPYFSTSESKTGLGLNIARDIIINNNGELYFDPTSTNTKFQMKFPRLEQA